MKFEAIVREVSADIEKEIANLANITTAGVAFHNASERVTRREWAAYVQTLDLPLLHRGIAALGVNQYVTRAGLADFIAEQRADGEPDFQVKFVNGLRDTPHDDLYVVKYIEPLAPNRKALGFDIGSEETRRRAAEYARDTGLFALTDVITLVQDRRNSPGFLFMKPLYRNGLPTAPWPSDAGRSRDWSAARSSATGCWRMWRPNSCSSPASGCSTSAPGALAN
ncbi:MAG: CHASE domain-containing protein [Kiritimatiellia bacterium]